MTTTTSFSESKRFYNFFYNLLKRNSGYIIFLTAVEFLFFPVQLALKRFSSVPKEMYSREFLFEIQLAPFHTSFSAAFIIIITLLATIVIGISQFGFLQSKRSADVFHSIPLKRNSLLSANFLAAFVTVMLPLAINQVIAIIIAAVKYFTNAAFAFNPLTGLTDLLCWSVAVFSILACITFAQVQVGRIFDGFIFSMELLFAPIALEFLTLNLFSSFLSGYSMENSFNMANLMYFTPIAAIIGRYTLSPNNLNYADNLFISSMSILLWLFIGVLLTLGSLYIYNRRKTEIAESTVTTAPLAQAGKLAAVYVGGTIIGILVTSMFGDPRYSTWSFVIWTVAGAVTVYIFMEFILLRGFKGLSKGLGLGAATVALVGIFAVVLVTGGLGYEERIPESNAIQSITISYRGRYSDISELDASKPNKNYSEFTSSEITPPDKRDYSYRNVDTVTLSSPEAIKIVKDFHKGIIESNKLIKKSGRNEYSPSAFSVGKISYNLGNDKLIRTYHTVSDNLAPLVASLENTQEFKKLTHPIFRLNDEEFVSFTLSGNFAAQDSASNTDRSKIQAILSALRIDMLNENVTSSVQKKGIPSTIITFGLKKNPYKELLTENYFDNCYVILNSEYTNTLKILKSMGYEDYLKNEPEKFTFAQLTPGMMFGYTSNSAVAMIPYYFNKNEAESYREKFGTTDSGYFSDAENIKFLWENSKSMTYIGNKVMTVVFGSQDNSAASARFIDWDALPPKIQQQFPELMENSTVVAQPVKPIF